MAGQKTFHLERVVVALAASHPTPLFGFVFFYLKKLNENKLNTNDFVINMAKVSISNENSVIVLMEVKRKKIKDEIEESN